MRFIVIWFVGGALGLFGCGSDGGSGGGGTDGGGSRPIITMVAWDAAAGCMTNVNSDVVITVTASDPDTATGDLTYNGSANGCRGKIDEAVSTINCPNVATYPGMVTVADPDGNTSIPVAFPVPVCASGNCADNPAGCSL